MSKALDDIAESIVRLLDWLVEVAERVLVLAFVYVGLRLCYYVLHGTLSPGQKEAISNISESWKVILILFLVPLFYRTIRKFLERARKFAGIETEPPEEEKEALNPPPDQLET